MFMGKSSCWVSVASADSPFRCIWLTCSITVFLLGCILLSQAGTWLDDFEDDNPNGWEPFTPAPWEVKVQRGVLQCRVLPNPAFWAHHLLEWVPIAFEAETLTLKTTFPAPFAEGLPFGMALGKRRPLDFAGPLIDCYVFTASNEIWGIIALSAWRSGASAWEGKEPDGKLGDPIRHMRVEFESGRFRLYSDNNLMADFKDDEFPVVDVVGVFMSTVADATIERQIDDFILSGPTIPNGNGNWAVNPDGKLSTTWGNLRRLP